MPPQKRALKRPTGATRTPLNPDVEDDVQEDDDIEITPENEAGADDTTVTEPTTPEDQPTEAAPVEDPYAGYPPMKQMPRDGKTYRPLETVVFKGTKSGGLIRCEENIYRATLRADESRWRYRLILAKGSEVPAGKTRAIKGSAGEYETDQSNLI